MISSTPGVKSFDPYVIPYQGQVIRDVRKNYDYSLGTHEVLLSGAVGSAKSTLLAHLIVTHCIFNPGARFLIGRLSMPALRSTLFQKILEHIHSDLRAGIDYFVNFTSAKIDFQNGSQIISRSWSDKQYFKVRSLELSGAAIEEITENQDSEFYTEIKMRVGRLPHVKENIIISASNPDGPEHWAYKYFIEKDGHPTRHTYYSVTTDNPFLPSQYVEQLKRDLDPKMAERMIYGRWVEISGDKIYYAYEREKQFRNYAYKLNSQYPIILAWDFNIGDGKPMSMAVMQYIADEFHIFNEVVVSGGRTADTIEELHEKGLLDKKYRYIIAGDASGKHKDTRSSRSDYDIIRHELQNRGLQFDYHVPLANPPVRSRHNRVNAYCLNANNETRLYVYKDAPTVDEAFRLTKLKKGAGYIEDDSKSYQHIGTAVGYAIVFETANSARKPQGTILF